MCGIIGIIGKTPVAPLLVDALKRLEYRGYDSAGVATLVNGHIDRRREVGKIANLEAKLTREPLAGVIGIGHTRWATHGKPSERNAHPIATELVAVVHNGIIENHQELKIDLERDGYTFESDTDTEAVAQLLTSYLHDQMSPEAAVELAMKRLRGAFALVVMFTGRHDLLIGACHGSALAVGYGEDSMYIGTDALALAPFTSNVSYLVDDDIVVINRGTCRVKNRGKEVHREIRKSDVSASQMEKGEHSHFMLKEMHEQPTVIGETLGWYIDPLTRTVRFRDIEWDWNQATRLTLTGCGTAYFACLIAKYWFEKLARIPVDVDVASEFRYREPPLIEGGVCIAVSQSGETADTLAALKYAGSQRQTLMSVVNVRDSKIARASNMVFPTNAGPEIGVASTKAFTTQLTVLLCTALKAARSRGKLTSDQEKEIVSALIAAPAQISEILNDISPYRKVAGEVLAKSRDVLYLGRGLSYAIALEGALKLKEISYIHAEAYAAGEMKHGPIALIDENVPVVVIAPSDTLFDKTASNFEQVKTRGGKLILVSDKKGCGNLHGAVASLCIPETHPLVTPLLYTIPMQLLAYETALAKGTDIDQPRNLAKSVTVE